jgi:hypothetical protein
MADDMTSVVNVATIAADGADSPAKEAVTAPKSATLAEVKALAQGKIMDAITLVVQHIAGGSPSSCAIRLIGWHAPTGWTRRLVRGTE